MPLLQHVGRRSGFPLPEAPGVSSYSQDVMRLGMRRDLILLTLVGLVLRLACIGQPGHVVDLMTFGQWALGAADNPWNRVYEVTNANYPPGALLFFELIGRVYRTLVRSDPDGSLLRIALKLPNVLFDLAGGLVAYGIARRFAGHGPALLAAAFIDANPALIYDSSVWGQNDSITTVSALGSLWCLLTRRRAAAWCVLAFAVLNKPPVIVLAPLFVLEAFATGDVDERRRRLAQTAFGLTGALFCAYLIAAPFYTDRSIAGVFTRMWQWYGIGSSLYPYTSANAFNLYALSGDFFLSDTTRIGGVALKYVADLIFTAGAALIALRYVRRPDDRALLEASFLLLLLFFLVLTEMHERYLIYALTFAAPLTAVAQRYRWPIVALTLTQWLNLEYSLTYMWLNSDNPPGINPKEFAPVLARLCALTNIAVFAIVARSFMRRDDPAPATGTARSPT